MFTDARVKRRDNTDFMAGASERLSERPNHIRQPPRFRVGMDFAARQEDSHWWVWVLSRDLAYSRCNFIGLQIRLERRRDGDRPIGLLVSFHQGNEEPRQGSAAAI